MLGRFKKPLGGECFLPKQCVIVCSRIAVGRDTSLRGAYNQRGRRETKHFLLWEESTATRRESIPDFPLQKGDHFTVASIEKTKPLELQRRG